MHGRAFVPEAPGCLESRAPLSGAAGLPPDPVALSGLRFNTTIDRIRFDFEEYATGGNLPRLRSQLVRVVPMVPFGRVDGLGGTVNGILARMQEDVSSGVPRSVTGAYQDVVATIRADVRARIDDGNIVVVR